MQKIKVTIELEVRADAEDDESVRDATYEALVVAMESEELEYTFEAEETDEDDEF